MVEAAFCLSLLWLPLTLGTFEIGFNLIRAIQVTQICRDAGHIYSQGGDFTQSIYQNLLGTLMPSSFTLTATGNTVVYVETVAYIDSGACGKTSPCNNLGKNVFTKVVGLGNTGLRTSNFGNPLGCPSINSDGTIPSSVYLTNSCAVATNFSSVIPLTSSQYAFMSEMFVSSNTYNIWGFLGSSGAYARSIF